MHGFMDRDELEMIGFSSLGDNVKVDRNAVFYGIDRISIGSNSRIDAFSVISAGKDGIMIGDHVHIGVHVFLSGAARIEIHDFSSLSGRVTIYSSNDDFHGDGLTGPTVPDHLRNVHNAPVTVGRHCIVGAGSIVLPGVMIGDGACVGSLSLVKNDIPPFTIAAGTPARKVAVRKRDFLRLEHNLDD